MIRHLLALLIAASCFLLPAAEARAESPEPASSASSNPVERMYLVATYNLTAITAETGFIVMQPIGAEIGFRPEKRIELGVSFDYGVSNSALSCPECKAWRWHAVLRARVHVIKEPHLLDPWIGGGIGWEELSVPHMNATGIDPVAALDGVLETGLDFRIFDGVKVGPRVALEYALRGPDAPVWAYGNDWGPLTFETGVRLGYGF